MYAENARQKEKQILQKYSKEEYPAKNAQAKSYDQLKKIKLRSSLKQLLIKKRNIYMPLFSLFYYNEL